MRGSASILARCSVVSWVMVSALGMILSGCGANPTGVRRSNASGGGGSSSTDGSVGGNAGTIGSAGTTNAGGTGGGGAGTGGAPGGVGANGGGGGAGGSGGGENPAHVVMACDSLADVGVWESITPPDVSLAQDGAFNTGVNAFAFDPFNTATVYLGTCSQGIYKTTDCGATWVHINTGTNGPPLDGGRNWSLEVDPVDGSVYVNSGYGGPGGVWKSTNGGVDWTNLLPPGSEFDIVAGNFVEFIAINPNNHLHMLVSAHNFCTGAAAGGGTCFANTTDGGVTWKVTPSPEDMYFEGLTQTIIDENTWLVFTNGIYLTTDAGDTWTKTPIPATTTNGQIYQHSDGYYYLPASYGIVQSEDRLTWTQIKSAPNSMSLAGDGTTMFTSYPLDTVPYYTTSDDPTVWTAYSAPEPAVTRASWLMRYDLDHDLLYSSNESGGFWRVRTK
jgi:hypothetical protein